MIDLSINFPTCFICYDKEKENQTRDWLIEQNNKLWDEKKTIYDPCPVGWRVPSGDFWSKASGTEDHFGDMSYWNETLHGVEVPARICSDEPIWFPANGLLAGSSGSLMMVGNYGPQWSCTTELYDDTILKSTYYHGVFFNAENCGEVSNNKTHFADGYAVRCVAE